MKFKLCFLMAVLLSATMCIAQKDSAPKDWFHLNPSTDNYPGIDTRTTYEKLLKDRKSETVIVAVIDGGVDPMHEDLKDIMWNNPGEIPGNGIDDDKNGYVDDVHGWNFIGGKDGKNIGADALEITRLVAKYQKQFKGKDESDVANAIRYAVDNGASVINMSFGKSYSWNKAVVDEAVKYAQKNDVLLVHAAGNDGKDNDSTDNFPNDVYDKRGWFRPKKSKTWIEVGALNHDMGENTAASFSNYGKEGVDVFAPGVAIYSTTSDNLYDSYPGTSMASPMVAGVAALLRSYYPELSAKQVKSIIMESSVKTNRQVVKPGTDEKVSFSELSVTGGMLNSYNPSHAQFLLKRRRVDIYIKFLASNLNICSITTDTRAH